MQIQPYQIFPFLNPTTVSLPLSLKPPPPPASLLAPPSARLIPDMIHASTTRTTGMPALAVHHKYVLEASAAVAAEQDAFAGHGCCCKNVVW